jgi:hypothetical protein
MENDRTWRQRLYIIIFESDTRAGQRFDTALLLTILASLVVVMLDSIEGMHSQHRDLFNNLEWAFTALFALEYGLRLYCSPKPLGYAFSFFGLIDLLAVLPAILALAFADAQYLLIVRVIRMIRIFRVLKLRQYLSQANLLLTALRGSRRSRAPISPGSPRIAWPADRRPGTTRQSRPCPTGTPWPNRNPSTSSTRKCSGSLLPLPARPGDPPLPAPRLRQTASHARSTPSETRSASSEMATSSPSLPVGSRAALATRLPAMVASARRQPPVRLNLLSLIPSRQSARREVLPALARADGKLRRAAGTQGHASLRSGQLASVRGAGVGGGVRQPARLREERFVPRGALLDLRTCGKVSVCHDAAQGGAGQSHLR